MKINFCFVQNVSKINLASSTRKLGMHGEGESEIKDQGRLFGLIYLSRRQEQ
jgi:hypothetical protein